MTTFAVVAGVKNNGLTNGDSIWLPPVLGPMGGGLLGTLAYDLMIGRPLMRANALTNPTAGMDPNHVEPRATDLSGLPETLVALSANCPTSSRSRAGDAGV